MANKPSYKERIEAIIKQRNEQLMQEQAVKEIVDLYEPAFDFDKGIWERFKAFLKAENEMGRRFGRFLDVVVGRKINTARDFVRERILPHL